MIPFYYFIFIHTILQISYVLPLSILLFLHMKCIQITHCNSVSTTTPTIIVLPCHPFTHSYGQTSSPSHQSYSCTNTSICKTLISWTFFYSYILFLPFCAIETIFPCSPTTLGMHTSTRWRVNYAILTRPCFLCQVKD